MHLQTIACNQFSRNFYTNSIYFIFYIRYAAVAFAAVVAVVVVHYIIVRLFNKVKTSLEFFFTVCKCKRTENFVWNLRKVSKPKFNKNQAKQKTACAHSDVDGRCIHIGCSAAAALAHTHTHTLVHSV